MKPALLALLFGFALRAEWNPRAAADYLDGRQKDWFVWKTAQGVSGPCLSCHTNMAYLLARPALRRKLAENAPIDYETRWHDTLRGRLSAREGAQVVERFSKEPLSSQAVGVETVFAALFLAGTADEKPAFERLWSLQNKDAAWTWFSVNLDPWEMPESNYFGATLALMAMGRASPGYRSTAEWKQKEAALAAWLSTNRAVQPLHNQLMLLGASAEATGAIEAAVRRAIVKQAFAQQLPDGSWALSAVGPWNEHATSPKHDGPDAYATALAAWALKRGGIPADDPRLKRALAWLETHQAPGGYWDAVSMNKTYPAGSMMAGFMRDAATSFAVLALLEAPAVN